MCNFLEIGESSVRLHGNLYRKAYKYSHWRIYKWLVNMGVAFSNMDENILREWIVSVIQVEFATVIWSPNQEKNKR